LSLDYACAELDLFVLEAERKIMTDSQVGDQVF